MDFKQITDKNGTPKAKIVGKVFSTVNNDSPFRSLPNFSTPPSRFVKIFNPFERTLIDRVHLPTFSGSPSVFNPVINEEKFKWDIDDISNFKPADIDETTIDQHVNEVDPHVESIVQEKINRFFSEKAIVPSPMNVEIRKPLKLINTPSPLLQTKTFADGATQTMLSLPPQLPEEVEAVLKPYFNCSGNDQKQFDNNSSLHKKLFEAQSPESVCNVSRISDTLSPIQTVPVPLAEKNSIGFSCPLDLDDCALSPISRKTNRLSRSACRLDFSARMSVDTSNIVPNINDCDGCESPQNTSENWDMEYKQLSSSQSSSDSDKMDVSNSNTPHSKLFSSQRKRLSDSFRDEETKENDCKTEESFRKYRRQFAKEDNIDAGYLTGSSTFEESNLQMHVFASTPSKSRSQVY